jgi:hypothetical protein
LHWLWDDSCSTVVTLSSVIVEAKSILFGLQSTLKVIQSILACIFTSGVIGGSECGSRSSTSSVTSASMDTGTARAWGMSKWKS